MDAGTIPLTRSDRADLWTVIVVGAVAAAFTVGFAVTRLAGILPNSGVEVLVPFADTTAPVPIGPGGASVPVAIDEAVLTVSGLPGIVVGALALAVIVDAGMVLTIIGCLGALCRNLMTKGHAFSRTNTRLVTTTAVVLVAGTAIGTVFQTMGVNGAFATVGEGDYDNLVATASIAPYFIATGLAAVALAFKAGERLQRETEGLV